MVSVVSASAGCWFRRSLAYRISLNFCYLLSLRVAHGPSFLFLFFSRNHIHFAACIVADRVAHGPSFLVVLSHFLFHVSPLRFVLFLFHISVASATMVYYYVLLVQAHKHT